MLGDFVGLLVGGREVGGLVGGSVGAGVTFEGTQNSFDSELPNSPPSNIGVVFPFKNPL